MIAQKRHTPVGFRQSPDLRDVNLIREVAEQESLPMPFASLLHDRLLAGMAKEHGEMDWSALGLAVMEVAGLKLPSSA
jgi:3-hydroxyisobutyrate dehydrogenase-like beta-hydroxyacid dehydrogenase